MANVAIYARVSTTTQDYDRQLVELREYARKMEYDVIAEFTEKISGAKKVEERTAMMELLAFVEGNKVDKVLIYECSRLSRRAIDFLTIIEHLTAMKVSVYILQNGLETLLLSIPIIFRHFDTCGHLYRLAVHNILQIDRYLCISISLLILEYKRTSWIFCLLSSHL
jgi:DNA invertase Pin-like site-specific DNA recombinase